MKILPNILRRRSKDEDSMPTSSAYHWAVAQGAGVVLALDQFTKYLVQHIIPCDPGMVCRVSIPSEGFARITHIHNSGSIFGLFSGNNLPLIFVSFVGVCVLLYIYKIQIKPNNWFRLSIALQIGGALGNVTDRIRIGHVTDFIDIGVSAWRWPAFNIADASIITGLCLLVWTILLAERDDSDEQLI